MARLTTIKPMVATLAPRIATPRETRDTRYSTDAALRAKYKVKRWADIRIAILARDLWQCQMCGVLLRQGRTDEAAALIDHIKPAKLCPDLFYEPTNLQACCRNCHATHCTTIEAKHWPDPEAIAAAKRAIRPATP